MRNSQLLIVALAALAVSLGLPAGAGAAFCRAPPGQGAVDQYCEVIPTAGGSVPAASLGKGGADLSGSTLASLRRAGPDGLAVIAIAKASSAPLKNKQRVSRTPQVAASAPNGFFGAAAASLSHAATGGGWLPFGLLLIAAVAIAASWASRRRRER
jgi:hypothetical protein